MPGYQNKNSLPSFPTISPHQLLFLVITRISQVLDNRAPRRLLARGNLHFRASAAGWMRGSGRLHWFGVVVVVVVVVVFVRVELGFFQLGELHAFYFAGDDGVDAEVGGGELLLVWG